MPAPSAPRPVPRRGVTMLELMVVLTVMAVLAALAWPSLGRQLQRHRLQGVAQALAGDMAEARFEAARRGMPLYLQAQAGEPWCWALATAPQCACNSNQACQLKVVRAPDHPGIRLTAARSVRFDTDGRADGVVDAVLEAGADRLRVEIGTLGRARVCSLGEALPGAPAC